MDCRHSLKGPKYHKGIIRIYELQSKLNSLKGVISGIV